MDMNMKNLFMDNDLLELARQGNVDAQFNLAVCYYEGDGVPQNYVEAAKWYGAAADRGDRQAQFNLGLMFYQGKGIPKDYRYAYELFASAARHGDERARMGMEAILSEVEPALREELKALSPLPGGH